MGIARREDGARQWHLRHVTKGVADDRDRSARRLLARKSWIFHAQAVAKWRAVYWMTAALVAPVMNAVPKFFIARLFRYRNLIAAPNLLEF